MLGVFQALINILIYILSNIKLYLAIDWPFNIALAISMGDNMKRNLHDVVAKNDTSSLGYRYIHRYFSKDTKAYKQIGKQINSPISHVEFDEAN